MFHAISDLPLATTSPRPAGFDSQNSQVCEDRRLKRTEREKQREEQRKRREERRKEREMNKVKRIQKQNSTGFLYWNEYFIQCFLKRQINKWGTHKITITINFVPDDRTKNYIVFFNSR